MGLRASYVRHSDTAPFLLLAETGLRTRISAVFRKLEVGDQRNGENICGVSECEKRWHVDYSILTKSFTV